MKNMILTIIALQTLFGYAQNVTKMEYFLDSDLGFGLNNIVSITVGPDITQNIAVAIPSGATLGFHKIYLRAKADNGIWSQTVRKNITVIEQNHANNVIKGEYFFDADPSVAAAFSFAISDQNSDINQAFLAQVAANASVGYHKLYGRVKDALGKWSHTFRKNIQVVKNDGAIHIVEVESFYNSDLEFGNGSLLVLANPQSDGSWIVNLPYPAGNYNVVTPNPYLFLRVKDSDGQWSQTVFPDQINPLLSNFEVFGNHPVSIYPNPASNQLQIQIADAVKSVSVYDLNGRRHNVFVENENKTVHVSALAAGLYLLSVETSSGNASVKFVKN